MMELSKGQEVAALFDLDGVVFDTESQYSLFWGMKGNTYHPEVEHFENVIKGQTLGRFSTDGLPDAMTCSVR